MLVMEKFIVVVTIKKYKIKLFIRHIYQITVNYKSLDHLLINKELKNRSTTVIKSIIFSKHIAILAKKC